MPVISFTAADHVYRVDGRPVPSVTQILERAGLTPDYSQVPPATLMYARLRGEHVDQACDLLDMDDLDWSSVHPEAVPYVEAWARFRDRERYKPIVAQPRVFHAELDYCGTGDSFGLDGANAPTLAERKCTARIAPTYALQTAGIAMPGIGLACDESAGELLALRVQRRLIVQLRPDGEFRMVDCEQEAARTGRDDFSTFRAAVQVARWRMTTNGAGRR